MNVRYVPLGLAFVVFAGSLIACSGSSDSKPTDSTPAPTTGTTSENNTTSSTVDMKAVSYSKDVKPLFQKFCLSCHNSEKPKHGLDLSSPDGIKKGGRDGADITDGSSKDSKIMHHLNGDDGYDLMPPAGKLDADQIAMIAAWIDQGPKFD